MSHLSVSYDSTAGYLSAKNEIAQILRSLGDQKGEVELLMPGMVLVKTSLVARKITEELRERYVNDPESIKATLSWIPVDFVCPPTIADIKSTIREELKFMITPSDTYKIGIICPTKKVNEKEIKQAIDGLSGKENETAQHEIHVEVYDGYALLSYVRKADVFVR